jgi:hypothetical protein
MAQHEVSYVSSLFYQYKFTSNDLFGGVATTTSGDADAADDADPKIAIFFNTFSTNGSNSVQHAHDIISSQLRAVNAQPLLDGAHLYYVRIGNLDWEFPVAECRGDSTNSTVLTSGGHGHSGHSSRRQCTQIAAVPQGDEGLSLQPLHDYCVAHQRDRVVYMHSKGTFTVNPHNDQLRTILMKAIMSKECIDLPTEEGDGSSCNTCSTRFQFFPFYHYSGNMWVADCNYISKLIPPKDFEPSKRRVIATMKNHTRQVNDNWYETRLDNRTSYKFKKGSLSWIERRSWMGTDRYASEHWLGSHPDLKPCEVFGSQNGNPPITYGRDIDIPAFKPPTLLKIQDTMTTNRSAEVWVVGKTKDAVYHPWYTKYGRIYEYQHLYSKIPQNDSWFHTLWTQYPMPAAFGLVS